MDTIRSWLYKVGAEVWLRKEVIHRARLGKLINKMWQWILTFIAAWVLFSLSGCTPASNGSGNQPDPGPCDGLYAGRSISGEGFPSPVRGTLASEEGVWVIGSTQVELAIDGEGIIREDDIEVGLLDLNQCEGSATLSLGESTAAVNVSRVPCSPDLDESTDALQMDAAIIAGRWILTQPSIPAELATLEFDASGTMVSMEYPAEIGLIGVAGTFVIDGQVHDLPNGSGTYSAVANTHLDVQNDACLGFTLDITQDGTSRQVAWLFSGRVDPQSEAVESFWLENLIEGDATTRSFFAIDWMREEQDLFAEP